MSPHEALLNRTLGTLYEVMASSPAVSEFAHLSLISFNTLPHVVLPMRDIGEVDALPVLTCEGMTHFGALFDELRARMDADVPRLVQAGRSVLRPAVFLLTDGIPSDERAVWRAALDRLREPEWRYRPHILTYGFGEARAAFLAEVGTRAAFLAAPGSTNDDALSRAVASLVRTLVASARAEVLQIPTQLEGFTSIPVEYMN
jgi:uncharacterized protein YegL